MLKILSTYCNVIGGEYNNIYEDYCYEVNDSIKQEETEEVEEIPYDIIYYYFKDTIIEEFAKRNFTKEQRDFYTKLIKEEIEAYKERINREEWLSEGTKEKAIAKMEKMTYTVGVPDNFVKVEKNYNIDDKSSYINDAINIKKNIKQETMRQYK